MKPIIILTFLSAMYLSSCGGDKAREVASEQAAQPATYNPYSKSDIDFDTFRVDSVDDSGVRGWGYNILVDGKLYVHQPTVPAIMGNNGFSSKEKAEKTAQFVISKIRNNIIPPSVTPEELDSLEVLD